MRRGWAWPHLRWLLLIALVVEIVAVMLVLVGKAESVVGLLRRNGVALELRSPITLEIRSPTPSGEEYAYINQVSEYPADWTDAVCGTPVYPLRKPSKDLPNSIDSAACGARIKPPGEAPNIMIAHFPAELPMQVDLGNQDYNWYAFALDRGMVLAFFTYSDAEVSDPVTNLGETPVLVPLTQFGFNIYRGPGPP